MIDIKPYIHQVQYYETDMMGITHHANYLHWMEEARIDFMDQLGFPYKKMEELGIGSPVTKITCEYKHPSTFGDNITIEMIITSFNGIALTLEYIMKNENGKIVCKASSEHMFWNREGKLVRVNKELPEFSKVIEEVMNQ